MNNDFSSIDRLIEIGLSMATANQMISTMNNAINNMQMPGQTYVGPTSSNHQCNMSKFSIPATSKGSEYYLTIDNKVSGPYKYEELSKLVAKRKLNGTTLMWHVGLTGWKYASDIPEINKLILLNS